MLPMTPGAVFVCGFTFSMPLLVLGGPDSSGPGKPQYDDGTIVIPAADPAEPLRKEVSVALADRYLSDGSKAWSLSKNCVSCHTNGAYLTLRSPLTPWLGMPDAGARDFFVGELKRLRAAQPDSLQKGTKPAQAIYLAAGLAEWDRSVTKGLSPETISALELMFRLQLPEGSWASLDCWPPYESDAWHLATVAAGAAGSAPGWLDSASGKNHQRQLGRLQSYLTQQKPPHDYGATLLLLASTRMSGIVDMARKQELIEMILGHQRADGGWSIRTFARPESWGRGNRAEKLRAEPEADDPSSDGHQTGLALVALHEAGVLSDDPRLRRGIDWLRSHQQQSGRWWTRSLNTDTYHFITYSGTAYPLLALGLYGELPLAR